VHVVATAVVLVDPLVDELLAELDDVLVDELRSEPAQAASVTMPNEPSSPNARRRLRTSSLSFVIGGTFVGSAGRPL
jgi:hypothetical protein